MAQYHREAATVRPSVRPQCGVTWSSGLAGQWWADRDGAQAAPGTVLLGRRPPPPRRNGKYVCEKSWRTGGDGGAGRWHCEETNAAAALRPAFVSATCCKHYAAEGRRCMCTITVYVPRTLVAATENDYRIGMRDFNHAVYSLNSTKAVSSRGCRRVGRLPRSACHALTSLVGRRSAAV